MMKEREYLLLEAINQNSHVTQAGLASKLGIAVGSVNWYIQRLINRGYLKATRMDRTRLKYNLTSKGMKEFRIRATQYMKDSLVIYRELRNLAKLTINDLQIKNISEVEIIGKGNDEALDIMRLTCIEAGIDVNDQDSEWAILFANKDYQLLKKDNLKAGNVNYR
ncbi:winged helix-turn-helix transcriptional regulator [Chloroflexota bacterium]